MEHFENSEDFAGLNVNSGVEQQPSVNPYLKKRGITRRKFTAEEYAEGILKGDISILSQAVTLIESNLPAHQEIHGRSRG